MKLIFAGACVGWSLLFLGAAGLPASAAEDTAGVVAASDTTVAREDSTAGDAGGPETLQFLKPDSTGRVGVVGKSERGELKKMLMQLGSSEVDGVRQWQRRKIPKLAMLSSAVLPGLGQLYAGRRIKVGIVGGLFFTYMAKAWFHWSDAQAAIAYRDRLPENATFKVVDFQNRLIEFHKESTRDYLWWSGAIWVLGILDAWIDAHLYDIRVYTPESNVSAEQKTVAPGTQQYLILSIGF